MKVILLLLFILSTLTSKAQTNYNYYYDFEVQSINRNGLLDEMKGEVKEVRIKKTHRKEKNNRSIEKHYDQNGMVTVYEVNDRFGKLKQKAEAQYNMKGNLTHFKSYSEKGISKERVNTYDEKLRLTETVQKNKKGKISRRSTWVYADGDCAIQSKSYKSNGEKLNNVWDYTYYKDCDRKRTTLKNAKGKIKKTWSYDCKQEGEQLTKKKDETQVCKWEESDGKYLTRIYQNFDEKGHIRKTVQKYTLEDTLILEVSNYNGSDQLTSKWTYDKSFDRATSYAYYNKKGEVRYRQETVYVDGLIQKSTRFKKDKKTSETVYTYNDQNWLTKIVNIDKKGTNYLTEEYEYIL